MEKTTISSLVIAMSLLSAAPIMASAQSSQWWRISAITDDINIDTWSAFTEKTSNKKITRAELDKMRKEITEHPINIITGTCEDFKKRYYEGGGAKTPEGKYLGTGGITQPIKPFRHGSGADEHASYVSWEPITEKDIIIDYQVIENELVALAIMKIKPVFDISSVSYGLFWNNPGDCKGMYEKFLDSVAVHEAKHREDNRQVIEKYKKYMKTYTITGKGKDPNEAREDAYFQLQYVFPKKMNNAIDSDIARKSKQYDESPEGSKKFYWDCCSCDVKKTLDTCEIWNAVPEIESQPTPQPPPTEPTPQPPPTEPTPQPPPTGPPDPTCPDGQVLEDGECVDRVVDCEEGQVLEDGECVDRVVDCEEGQVLEDGECVDRVVDCEEGQVLEDGECVEPPEEPTEEPGEVWN